VRNRWSSHETAEAPVEWVLSFPDGGPAARRAIAAEVLAVGEATGMFVVTDVQVGELRLAGATSNDAWTALVDGRALDEPLPFEDPLLGGEGAVVVQTDVWVRDRDGNVVARKAADAGALLRELEEDLDEAHARRFAAHKPFCAPWGERDDGKWEVRFGFWTDLFWLRLDDELRAKNGARLVELRTRLQAIARAHKGTATLPVPTDAA